MLLIIGSSGGVCATPPLPTLNIFSEKEMHVGLGGLHVNYSNQPLLFMERKKIVWSEKGSQLWVKNMYNN